MKSIKDILSYEKFVDTIIQIYNCCVDMFAKDLYTEAVDWANKLLDLIPLLNSSSSSEEDQIEVLTKNCYRLLSMNIFFTEFGMVLTFQM